MKNNRSRIDLIKTIARVLGISLALPFFLWVPLGLLPSIPSIIDVFGFDGLRYPTGVVIGGLMLAAFGFEDF
mgnify:CR=1 FL=1